LASYKDFGLYLYGRLPDVWRSEDEKNNLQLKRFLEACDEAGFGVIQRELDRLPNIIDLDTCTDEQAELVGSLLGLSNDFGIPLVPFRKLLKVITEIYKRKTTASILSYLARVLSGFQVDITRMLDANMFLTYSASIEEDDWSLTILDEFVSGSNILYQSFYGVKKTYQILFHYPIEGAETTVLLNTICAVMEVFRPVTCLFTYVMAYDDVIPDVWDSSLSVDTIKKTISSLGIPSAEAFGSATIRLSFDSTVPFNHRQNFNSGCRFND